jgi:hypothetical protein
MQIVRFTCDLWRAAPFAPVTLRVRTLREGKSAEWLEADLCTGDEVAARASALRLRMEDVNAPPDRVPPATGGARGRVARGTLARRTQRQRGPVPTS